MKNILKKTLLILTVLVISSSVVFAGGEVKQKIQKLTDKMVKAVLAKDQATLMSMYTDDCYAMPSYSPMMHGKEAMAKRAKEQHAKEPEMKSFSLKTVDVFGHGDQLVQVGTYSLSLVMPGQTKAMNDKGKFLTVWHKQKDGSWKIKAETWNTDMNPMAMMQQGKN